MDITLIDALVLVGVLAFLMLGFANRRVATASAVRGLNHDHLKGNMHHKADDTMKVLRDRLTLESNMLVSASFGALFALVSAALVVGDLALLAKIAFFIGIFGGFLSLIFSIREQMIANKSHFGELDNTISKHDPYYNTAP